MTFVLVLQGDVPVPFLELFRLFQNPTFDIKVQISGFAAGGVRIPFQELLQQQPNQIMQYPLYDRCKEAAGTIQVRAFSLLLLALCDCCFQFLLFLF